MFVSKSIISSHDILKIETLIIQWGKEVWMKCLTTMSNCSQLTIRIVSEVSEQLT